MKLKLTGNYHIEVHSPKEYQVFEIDKKISTHNSLYVAVSMAAELIVIDEYKEEELTPNKFTSEVESKVEELWNGVVEYD